MVFNALKCSIDEREFRLFSNYIAEKSGIVIPPEKAYLIETRLSKLMTDAGVDSFVEFYDHIVSKPDDGMQQKIINAITINETKWFRDEIPWKILEESVLPALIEKLVSGQKSKIRIWCAAVSTGQEAYSTVMCVDDYLEKKQIKGVSLSDFEFLATDISGHVLNIAQKGRYDKISIMRGLNDYYRTKYFKNNDPAWELEPKIKNAVQFERFNLQENYMRFGLFDVIFCRYVLIYFSNETKKEIIAKMYDSLTDGGVFFSGNYALYNLFSDDDFELRHYDNLTYYIKK